MRADSHTDTGGYRRKARSSRLGMITYPFKNIVSRLMCPGDWSFTLIPCAGRSSGTSTPAPARWAHRTCNPCPDTIRAQTANVKAAEKTSLHGMEHATFDLNVGVQVVRGCLG